MRLRSAQEAACSLLGVNTIRIGGRVNDGDFFSMPVVVQISSSSASSRRGLFLGMGHIEGERAPSAVALASFSVIVDGVVAAAVAVATVDGASAVAELS